MITVTNHKWTIETELTLKTVANIYRNFRKNLKKIDKTWIIDFARCDRIDSEGLSLIIEYIKYAQKNNIQIVFKNIDQKTLSLAKVHGAKTILEEYIN
ncbi:STAS domain-containing protein [Francisella tularensis]|uniref:STAS domain-containing protein n=1 Tax=Francisella tularensis TaxID=263 RepID=UPI001C0EEB65|nr:STAS domain-containing protein [Francisella tularensis]MBK2142357.1 STAS domain-containing protein [Francisella tularensis]